MLSSSVASAPPAEPSIGVLSESLVVSPSLLVFDVFLSLLVLSELEAFSVLSS